MKKIKFKHGPKLRTFDKMLLDGYRRINPNNFLNQFVILDFKKNGGYTYQEIQKVCYETLLERELLYFKSLKSTFKKIFAKSNTDMKLRYYKLYKEVIN